MRICIPTGDSEGLKSRLYDHFGIAPFFALADTESGEVEMVANSGHHHGHGQCQPIRHIDASRTDAVVCRGMGKRALASLNRGSMAVLITSATTVADVVADARDGKLRKLTSSEACGGHGGRHGRGHGCGHGDGHGGGHRS